MSNHPHPPHRDLLSSGLWNHSSLEVFVHINSDCAHRSRRHRGEADELIPFSFNNSIIGIPEVLQFTVRLLEGETQHTHTHTCLHASFLIQLVILSQRVSKHTHSHVHSPTITLECTGSTYDLSGVGCRCDMWFQVSY